MYLIIVQSGKSQARLELTGAQLNMLLLLGCQLLGAYVPRIGKTGHTAAHHHVPRTALVAASASLPKDYNPTANSEVGGIGTLQDGIERPDGAHGTGFRFMPMSSMNRDDSPVLLCLAGAYPGITADQLMAPSPLPFAPKGKWTYHRLTGDAAPTGFVVLPGSVLLETHPNTVGIVCTSTSLGLELADGQEHEVIALIDRSPVEELDNMCFYAFADPSGAVSIRWMQALPEGWRMLGRLIYTQLPFVPKPGGESGFAETSDDFDF